MRLERSRNASGWDYSRGETRAEEALSQAVPEWEGAASSAKGNQFRGALERSSTDVNGLY